MGRRVIRAFGLLVVLGLWSMSIGCAGSEACPVVGIAVVPSSATADHSAPPPPLCFGGMVPCYPPGNQQHFFATAQGAEVPACTKPSSPGGPKDAESIALTNVVWSVSDPVNVTISNTMGPTFGTATCVGGTAGPVTVTAQGLGKLSGFSATAALVCK